MISTVSWLVGTASAPRAKFGSVTGRETPKGRIVALTSLAQRPGTAMSALLLTRRLIERARPGDILVACAASEDLAAAYERFGFTRVPGTLRVYCVAP